MKKTITALTGTALLSVAGMANAGIVPLVNVEVAGTYWSAKPSGHVESGGRIDLEDDLNYGRDQYTGWHLRVAHPIPLIPNFRVRYTDFEESARGTVATTFEGQTYTGDVDSSLDLSHFDYTIFYTAPLPMVGLDLGFNVKHFDGEFSIEERGGTQNSDSVSINEWLPMLYGHARVDLPLTGLGAGVELSYISYSGDSVSDLEAYVSYSYNIVFVQGGYRDFRVDVEGSGDLEVDTDVGGPFIRLGARF